MKVHFGFFQMHDMKFGFGIFFPAAAHSQRVTNISRKVKEPILQSDGRQLWLATHFHIYFHLHEIFMPL